MPTRTVNNSITNPLSIPEIPVQNTDAPVEHAIKFDADIFAFLTEHQKGRGDLNHCVNQIVKVYRECLPPDRRGPRTDDQAKPTQQAGHSNGKSPQPNGAGKATNA
jgi:hypothetical protein